MSTWAIRVGAICCFVLILALVIFFVTRGRPDPYNEIEGQEGVVKKISDLEYEVTRDWLGVNLYRVMTYRQLDDGDVYRITLLDIENPANQSFEELIKLFNETPITTTNNVNLADGVNCQGMTCYLASWCRQTGHVYTISYTSWHTNITIEYHGEWYRFDFTEDRSITKLDYQKGE